MTILVPGVDDLATVADVPEVLRPVLETVAALRSQIRELEAQLAHAEAGLLIATREAIAADAVSRDELADFYVSARAVASGTFHQRWNDVVPIRANGLASRVAHRARMAALIAQPNGPDGTYWTGVAPIGLHDPRPGRGAPVAYLLFDEGEAPIYAGSTDNFQVRLMTHVRNGKPVSRWRAFPCETREGAYRLEQELLDRHAPPLNASLDAKGFRCRCCASR